MSASASLGTALVTLGGAAGGLAAVAALKDRPPFRWLLERLSEIGRTQAHEIIDQRLDERLMPTVHAIQASVDSIHHEMHPNSSLSMRDAIDRTESTVVQVSAKVSALDGRVSRVEGAVDVLAANRQG